MELDHSGFSTQYPTVFAGNLGNGKYVLQVSVFVYEHVSCSHGAL